MDKTRDSFDHLPPLLVHVVIECPLIIYLNRTPGLARMHFDAIINKVSGELSSHTVVDCELEAITDGIAMTSII